eukprot:COSAG04_NODE_5802_length_1488_cov_6.581713_2_plen_155_part_00
MASTKSRPRISSAPKLLRVAGSVWRWWWFAHRHGAADAHLNLIPCRPNNTPAKLLATTSRRRLCSPMFDRKQSLPVPVRFETTKQRNGFPRPEQKRRAGSHQPRPPKCIRRSSCGLRPARWRREGAMCPCTSASCLRTGESHVSTGRGRGFRVL